MERLTMDYKMRGISYNSYNPFDFGPDYPSTKMQILPFS